MHEQTRWRAVWSPCRSAGHADARKAAVDAIALPTFSRVVLARVPVAAFFFYVEFFIFFAFFIRLRTILSLLETRGDGVLGGMVRSKHVMVRAPVLVEHAAMCYRYDAP